MSTDVVRLQANLRTLGVRAIAAVVEAEADKAAKSGTTDLSFLAKLVDEDLAAKVDRSVNTRL
ncbi:MAG TPA: hypothetical protein VKX96_06525 [Chloroflexota bacterium]|nr:hypothetical protein [Chloroflexota bacterium]